MKNNSPSQLSSIKNSPSHKVIKARNYSLFEKKENNSPQSVLMVIIAYNSNDTEKENAHTQKNEYGHKGIAK